MNQKIRRKNRDNGITLIALVVTVIILLILAGVSVTMLTGNNGILNQAVKAKFYTEMSTLEEQKEMTKIASFMVTGDESNFSQDFLISNVPVNEINKFSNTLKAEIIFARNSFGEGEALTTKQIWKNNLYECQDIFSNEDYVDGLSKDIYYISEKVSEKSKVYIYDAVTDLCFKIEPTKIGHDTVHSLRYAKFILDGENSTGIGVVDIETNVISATDGTKCYEPDLNNFSYKTEIVYYSPDLKQESTINIKEFIEKGKPSTMQVNNETYTFANYVSSDSGQTKVWANIKCTANGLESYWTWIPRFAYKLDGSVEKKEKSAIIFVDINDKPIDGSELPEGYVVHEAFKQKSNLKGIWFSKYQPTALETLAIDKTEPETPDLSNFSTDDTKLIYYTKDGSKSTEVEFTQTPSQTIQKDNETYYFYNYENKIWANVKCTANGLESYWVWIPRFAYKLESGESSVILVDQNDKPIDKETYGSSLPTGYKVHEAFSQGDGLKGFWFSKYQPSSIETGKQDTSEPALPNLNNFDSNHTKLIYYTIDGKNSIEADFTLNPERVIEQNGVKYYFYSYGSKIWANVKCTANGLESYWTWIPRFAYKLEDGTTQVILVDENDKPLNTTLFGNYLPEGYTVHEAFKQGDGLKGIWFSKYQPSSVE